MAPPIYYPGFTVRLGCRFDEALFGVPLTPNSDATASSIDLAAQTPLQQQRPGAKDGLSYKTQLTPLRCTVDIPGYRSAGKFTLEVPFRDFPFEPDVLRAVAVEIYGGTIPADQWARGQAAANAVQPTPGGGFALPQGGIRQSQLVPHDNPNDPLFNEVLVGIADLVRVEHSDKGDVTFIEGRDLRGILLDIPIAPTLLSALRVNRPIHEVVRSILDANPILTRALGARSVSVVTQEDEWEGGVVPAPNAPDVMTRVNLGAVPQQAGAAGNAVPMPTGAAQMKVWDLITNLCQFVGAVPYFVGRQLRIRPARALWDPHKLPGFDPRFPTPFYGELPRLLTGADGLNYSTNIRVMSWGRNVLTLKRERKLGGQKVPTVVVTSIDTSPAHRGLKNRYIEAQYPQVVATGGIGALKAKQARASAVSADGSVVQNQPIYVSVPGIRSRTRLQQIARDIYEEIGRGELSGTCSTRDLASLGGDNGDPDMLRLRPGDPVRFVVDDRDLRSYPPPINSVLDIYTRDPEQVAKILGDRLGDADLGRVLAYSLTGRIANRQAIYRASNVRFSWDSQKGVGIDFDFQNYVESRAGAAAEPTKPNQRPIKAAAQPVVATQSPTADQQLG